MSLYGNVAKFVLAAGIVVLGAGCGGREKVAIANKDETIRQQKEVIAQERKEKDDALAQAAREKEELASINKKLADQNREMADRTARGLGNNTQQVALLQTKIDDLEAVVKGMNNNLVALKSKGDYQGGDAVLRDSEGGIRIIVANTTLFDSGHADLKSTSHKTISDLANTLKTKFPKNYIRIEGHTDSTPVVHSRGSFKDNMGLSLARARAVYDQLVKEGVAGHRLYTAGYGASQPLVAEKTAADRAKNRRVEIVIMPDNVKVQKDYGGVAQAGPIPASKAVKK